MYDEIKYLLYGDKAIVIELGNSINKEINTRVRNMMLSIEKENIYGVEEIVPTYRSLMINYNPFKIDFDTLIKKLKLIGKKFNKLSTMKSIVIEIPTLYGDEFGVDIKTVAKHNKMSIQEVIEIHSSCKYLIYMLGFTPGFPYLGGMDERISTPRLKVPRTKIKKGCVGIAGNQTGIYPMDSPGGWQLIGKTPVKLYDETKENPFLLKPGNYLKFVEINRNEFEKISKAVNEGLYECRAYPTGEEEL